MATIRRKGRNSSSDSTGGSSSEDDRLSRTTVVKPSNNKPLELTLKDDEDILPIQAPLPEEEEAGESDDDRLGVPRANQSSASGTLDDEHDHRKQPIARKKRKRFKTTNDHIPYL